VDPDRLKLVVPNKSRKYYDNLLRGGPDAAEAVAPATAGKLEDDDAGHPIIQQSFYFGCNNGLRLLG
jgi:hypothetical protein